MIIRLHSQIEAGPGRERPLPQRTATMDAHHLVKVEPNPEIEDFQPGDTVRVSIRVTEGDRQRTQVFEGVVIRKRGSGPGATFTVRRGHPRGGSGAHLPGTFPHGRGGPGHPTRQGQASPAPLPAWPLRPPGQDPRAPLALRTQPRGCSVDLRLETCTDCYHLSRRLRPRCALV